jgi:hypothetical protein
MFNIPKKLWSEACNYTQFLLNCTIEKGQTQSRYERFYGIRPSLKHIHRFGTYVIYKNNRPDRLKMDDKGFAGIYVGYNYDDLTYRIYDIEKKIVINSRDVQFFDDVIVKPESDEQLVVTEEVEEDQFELEEITHHNNDEEEEDELLYHYSPTTTPTIPMDIINNNNNNNNNNIINEGRVTGVKISPIVMNSLLLHAMVLRIQGQRKP